MTVSELALRPPLRRGAAREAAARRRRAQARRPSRVRRSRRRRRRGARAIDRETSGAPRLYITSHAPTKIVITSMYYIAFVATECRSSKVTELIQPNSSEVLPRVSELIRRRSTQRASDWAPHPPLCRPLPPNRPKLFCEWQKQPRRPPAIGSSIVGWSVVRERNILVY